MAPKRRTGPSRLETCRDDLMHCQQMLEDANRRLSGRTVAIAPWQQQEHKSRAVGYNPSGSISPSALPFPRLAAPPSRSPSASASASQQTRMLEDVGRLSNMARSYRSRYEALAARAERLRSENRRLRRSLVLYRNELRTSLQTERACRTRLAQIIALLPPGTIPEQPIQID